MTVRRPPYVVRPPEDDEFIIGDPSWVVAIGHRSASRSFDTKREAINYVENRLSNRKADDFPGRLDLDANFNYLKFDPYDPYWFRGLWKETFKAPIIVDSVGRGTWSVQVGEGGEVIDVVDSKSDAIDLAVSEIGNDRPGVIVRKTGGDYQRMVPIKEFWDQWA